jgi:hypothetical protein
MVSRSATTRGRWLRRAPVLLDRWTSGLEVWSRGHFSVVLALTFVLIITNELVLFGPDITQWDPLYVSSVLVFVVTLRAALELDDRCMSMLSRLARRGTLDTSGVSTDALQQRIRVRSQVWAHWTGLITAAVALAAFVVAYIGAQRSEVLFTALATLGGYLAGRAVGRALAFGRIGTWLVRWHHSMMTMPGHPDGAAGMKPVGDFYSFQAALIAIPAFYLAFWWLAIGAVPAFQRYDYWRQPYLGMLAIVLCAQILGFIAPLLSFHRIMKKQKHLLLDEADVIGQEMHDIRSRIPSVRNDKEINELQERLELLSSRYVDIETMPTWPVDKRTRRRFEYRNIVLAIPILGKALSLLLPSWEDALEEVTNIFS